MAEYAYIRVSTKEQNIQRQLDALQEYHLERRQIFIDRQSGKDFDRPAYRKLVKKLKNGDLLIIKSIDRLGRNYSEILVQWQHITKEIEADILVLDMDLLDTRKDENNLTGRLIADLVLQIFAYVAQTEREFIRQRQAEGIAAAKARGVKFGPRCRPLPDGFDTVCRKCVSGELSVRKEAKLLGMSHATFYRRYRGKIGNNDSFIDNIIHECYNSIRSKIIEIMVENMTDYR